MAHLMRIIRFSGGSRPIIVCIWRRKLVAILAIE
jgi:hypothetical protein